MAATAKRRSINLSVRSDLAEESREHGLNLSRVLETALTNELREARGRRWLAENKEAIESWNAWTRENGLPLEKYRQF